MSEEVKVSVVDDDAEFRESLALLVHGSPGLCCVSRYADGADAAEGLIGDRPDVVLMDIQMPRLPGIQCLNAIRTKLPDTQFIMLTSYSDDERVFESLQAGATGYLLKRSSPSKILEAISDAHTGGSPMSSYIARRVVQSFNCPRPPAATKLAGGDSNVDAASLSPREEEILALLTQGFLYKEIADQLSISLDTVRTHLRRIYEKLHVHSRTEAVVKYLKR